MKADSIAHVLQILDQIIDDCKRKENRLGYFAALYRKMTHGVQMGIQQGLFEDGARMEHLDVVFANRYLEAYEAFARKAKPTGSWLSAFNCCGQTHPIVLQHLLLGMNAHINLDLGIAVAAVSSTPSASMKRDYDKINHIIASYFGLMQDNLTKIAWPMYFIQRINPDATTAVLNFSIGKARELAWNNAVLLMNAGKANFEEVVRCSDEVVNKVAQRIIQPGTWSATLLRMIRMAEQKSVRKNIEALCST